MVVNSGNRSTTPWWTIGYILFALVGAILLARFSFGLAASLGMLALAPLIFAGVRATRSRLGDVQPTLTAGSVDPAHMREFETLPFDSPFSPASAHLSLAIRITMAAEASAEYSRGASVLFLPVESDAEAAKAFAVLRDALRPTDHVEIVDDGVVACLNLIRDLANVDGVIARLTRKLVESGWPPETPPRFGRALYPMHGYSGADLMESARAQAQAAVAAAAESRAQRARQTRPASRQNAQGRTR